MVELPNYFLRLVIKKNLLHERKSFLLPCEIDFWIIKTCKVGCPIYDKCKNKTRKELPYREKRMFLKKEFIHWYHLQFFSNFYKNDLDK